MRSARTTVEGTGPRHRVTARRARSSLGGRPSPRWPSRISWLPSGSICAAFLAIAPAAQAVEKVACLSAHEAAQELRQRSELEPARAQLVVCSDPDCPALVTADCRAWLAEVEVQLNAARTVAPQAIVPVSVALETSPEAAPAPASSPPPDTPAPLSRPGRAPPPPTPHPRASWRAPLVTGALATAALGNAAYFGYRGLAEADQLRRTCSPACDPAAVTPVRRMLLIADLSMLAGVGLGTLTAWLLWDRRDRDAGGSVASSSQRRSEQLSGPGWSAIAGFGSLGVQYGGQF